MLNEPLTAAAAKFLALSILETGSYAILEHAELRFAERDMDLIDCTNIIRRGQVTDILFRKGTWRYRFEVGTLGVVVLFEDESTMWLMTAWREPKKEQ